MAHYVGRGQLTRRTAPHIYSGRTLLPNAAKLPLFFVSRSNNGILTPIDPKIISSTCADKQTTIPAMSLFAVASSLWLESAHSADTTTQIKTPPRFPIFCMTLAASSLTWISRKVSAKHCQQTLLAFFSRPSRFRVMSSTSRKMWSQNRSVHRPLPSTILSPGAMLRGRSLTRMMAAFNSSTDVFTSTGWLTEPMKAVWP